MLDRGNDPAGMYFLELKTSTSQYFGKFCRK